jgi:MFS transporter, DHA2 family, multidrug resistance protein
MTNQKSGDRGRTDGRWWALAAIALALVAVGLDTTVLTVALPTISVDLGASIGQLQWFASGYALAMAATLLPAGMLGDRYGRRPLLLLALCAFGATSVWCAHAGSPAQLVAARVLLGGCAAFLVPLSMSVFLVLFPEQGERQRAMAVLSSATMLGLPLGPVLGGYLLRSFWWGSVFLINVPLVALAIAAVTLLVPDSRGIVTPRIDATGMLLSSVGLAALTYGVIAAGEHSWTAASALAPVAAGALLLAGFVAWERRTAYPLVELGLFRSSGFAWGAVLATLVGFALLGLMFFLPLYYQEIQGSDPLGAGLKLLPMIAGVLAGAGVAGRMRPDAGARTVPATGFALMAAALLVGSTTSVGTGYGFAAGWLTVLGIGVGLAMTRTMTGALDAVAVGRAGAGTALLQTLRQVGGAFGVALLGAFANSGYQDGVQVGGLPAPLAETVRGGVAGGVAVARRLGRPGLLADVRGAYVDAMDATLLICAGIAALAAILALVFLAPAPGRPVPARDEDRERQPLRSS